MIHRMKVAKSSKKGLWMADIVAPEHFGYTQSDPRTTLVADKSMIPYLTG